MSNEQEMREVAEKILRETDQLGFIKPGTIAWIVAVSAVQSATLAAEARIRELEADAKRYRWLRDKSEYGDDFYLSVPFESPKDTFKPHEVDEAIDAALTEHKENQG